MSVGEQSSEGETVLPPSSPAPPVLAELIASGRRQRRVAVAMLVGTGLLAGVLATGVGMLVDRALSDDSSADVGHGEPASQPDPPLFWLLFFLGGTAVALASLQRRTGWGRLAAPVTDPRLVGLVRERAAAFRTHAPEQVRVALTSGVEVTDDLPALTHRVCRVAVIGGAFLGPEQEPALVHALDEQFARLAGSGWIGASLRARGGYLAAVGEEPFGGGFAGRKRGSPPLGVLDFWGRSAVRPIGFLLAKAGFFARMRLAEERALAGWEQTLPKAAPKTKKLLRSFDAYVETACRGVMAFDLLPSDALDGFVECHDARADGPRVPGVSSTPASRSTPAPVLDPVAQALALGLDHAALSRLRPRPWGALLQGELRAALSLRADETARRLAKSPRQVANAAETFVRLVARLEAGQGQECGLRLAPELRKLEGTGYAVAFNRALFGALASLLATALCARGALLLDPRFSGGIAVRLPGTHEIVQVQRLVLEGLKDAAGAAELRDWAGRLTEGVEGAGYRDPRVDFREDRAREAHASTIAEDAGERALQARASLQDALRRANAARVVAAGRFLAVALLSTTLIFCVAPFCWGWVSERSHPERQGQTALLLAVISAFFAMVSFVGLRPPAGRPRPAQPLRVTTRVRKAIVRAARRHATEAPHEVVVVADLSDRPLAEVIDSVSWIGARRRRTLLLSEAVLGRAEHEDLVGALRSAFAPVAGLSRFEASIEARARLLRSLDGRVRGLGRDGGALAQVVLLIHAIAHVGVWGARAFAVREWQRREAVATSAATSWVRGLSARSPVVRPH
jgi:hypothetical protein